MLQLPTLYFAVLMFAHMVDHFVLTSRYLTSRTKWIIYGSLITAIVANFWWFRGMAFGIDGPIKDYWGVQWRKVCYILCNDLYFDIFADKRCSRGIYMICSVITMFYLSWSGYPSLAHLLLRSWATYTWGIWLS
jgi:hypothetical protein